MRRRSLPKVVGRRPSRLAGWAGSGHPRRRWAIAAAVAALTAAGLLVAAVRDGARDPAAHAARDSSRVVARGGLRASLPPGWRIARRAPALPGMRFSDPLAIVEPKRGVEIVGGLLPATSRTLLPAAFLRGVDRKPAAPRRVRLARDVEAFAYRGLAHPDVGSLLDVYVVPTMVGVATIACLADTPTPAFDACWSVVSTLTLTRGTPLRLGADAGFRAQLTAEVAGMNASEASARQGLTHAATTTEQADATSRLPAVYRRAAAALAPLAGGSMPWADAIVAAVRRIGSAYRSFEDSLRHHDLGAFAHDSRRLRAARARLRRLLESTPLGSYG
jgi:hypothetical protein